MADALSKEAIERVRLLGYALAQSDRDTIWALIDRNKALEAERSRESLIRTWPADHCKTCGDAGHHPNDTCNTVAESVEQLTIDANDVHPSRKGPMCTVNTYDLLQALAEIASLKAERDLLLRVAEAAQRTRVPGRFINCALADALDAWKEAVKP